MGDTFRLGWFAGVPIGVNWTVLFVFGLITVVLANAEFPAQFPEQSALAHTAAGLLAGVLFLASLLLHEIAHVLAARRHGAEVERVTLWLLGGFAVLAKEPDDPKVMVRISTVGPLVSFGLSMLSVAATGGLYAIGAPGIVVAVAAWTAAINILLAVLNLLPAAPLDGGRVLHAVVWHRTGDARHAAEVAGRAGQALGFGVVVVGLLVFVFLPGLGGLWLALVGVFVMTAAAADGRARAGDAVLDETRVGDVMAHDPVTVPTGLDIASFLEQYVFATPHSAFPTVAEDGRPTGLVSLNRVKRVPPEDRAITRVDAVACPLDDLPTTRPDEPVSDLLPRVNGCVDGRALVMDGDELVGMVSARDLVRHLDPVPVRTVAPLEVREAA